MFTQSLHSCKKKCENKHRCTKSREARVASKWMIQETNHNTIVFCQDAAITTTENAKPTQTLWGNENNDILVHSYVAIISHLFDFTEEMEYVRFQMCSIHVSLPVCVITCVSFNKWINNRWRYLVTETESTKRTSPWQLSETFQKFYMTSRTCVETYVVCEALMRGNEKIQWNIDRTKTSTHTHTKNRESNANHAQI